jgi:putative FmdB family regulatory protein
MPIYEYRCSSCSHEFETLQKFSDPLLTRCPSCGVDSLVKKISAAGFQLKGTGWYATDFKGGGSKPAANDAKTGEAAAKGAESKPADGKSADTKSDTKSDSKSETKTESSKPTPAATGTGG